MAAEIAQNFFGSIQLAAKGKRKEVIDTPMAVCRFINLAGSPA
jgi:hypothetical protein